MTYQEYRRKHKDNKDRLEELEERAAIIEYCGDKDTFIAERMAVRVLMDRYGG